MMVDTPPPRAFARPMTAAIMDAEIRGRYTWMPDVCEQMLRIDTIVPAR